MRLNRANFYRYGVWILAATLIAELFIYAGLDKAPSDLSPEIDPKTREIDTTSGKSKPPAQSLTVRLGPQNPSETTEKQTWQNPTIRAYFHLEQTIGLNPFVRGFKPTETTLSDELANILGLTEQQRFAVDRLIGEARSSSLEIIDRYTTNEILEDGSILAIYDPPKESMSIVEDEFWRKTQSLIGEEKSRFFRYTLNNFSRSPDPVAGFAKTPTAAIFHVSKTADGINTQYVIHIERGSLETPNFKYTIQGEDFDPNWMHHEELLTMLTPELRQLFLSQWQGSPAP